jgi:Na+(H+)/acetate symporter ActP
MIPEMGEKKDVAINLNGINYEDEWDGDFLDRRSIVWTLNFTARSYIYGPFTKAGVIKKAIVYESIGDKNDSPDNRNTKLSYTPKALEDKNADGVINAADDALVISTDDFGFNEGIELL